MDRISGLMPQIGWSPVLMPAPPKHAPATTVEPAAKAANTNGGMGAEVDTQTGQDRAQQVRAQLMQQAVLSQGTATALAQDEGDTGPPPDPDAPTGPPPTFEMTPLEAEATRRKAVQNVRPMTTDTAPEGPIQGPMTEPAAAPLALSATTKAPADPPAPAPQGDWQKLDQAPEPSLDLTR